MFSAQQSVLGPLSLEDCVGQPCRTLGLAAVQRPLPVVVPWGLQNPSLSCFRALSGHISSHLKYGCLLASKSYNL